MKTASPLTEAVERQPATKAEQSYRPFEDIPAPKTLPLLGISWDMLVNGGTKMHEYCDRRHKELGPIFRDKLGTTDAVVISDTPSIHHTFRMEGKYPNHVIPEAWTMFNKMTDIRRGIFFFEGEQWFQRRALLNKVLFCPKAVSSHGPAFNSVITDLLKSWESLGEIHNLEGETYNWSVECLGVMLFARRLGCVATEGEPAMPRKFVEVVQQIFHETARMIMIPPSLACALNLPAWKRFYKAANDTLDMSRTCVRKRMREIEKLQAEGVKVNGVLAQLMSDKAIKEDEIVEIVADLIIAAADTTSHAVQWALHLLALNPDVQEKLLSEINQVVGPDELIEEHHLQKIPYSMWIVKETLRMYPVASFLTRIVPQEIYLHNYRIPKGTLVVMSQYTVGRDPERFPDPDRFYPDRWGELEDRRKKIGNQGCIPFATGSRSCIGRRVAELQMRLLLTRVAQKFKLESANEKEVGIVLRMITAPDTPIKLRLEKRKS